MVCNGTSWKGRRSGPALEGTGAPFPRDEESRGLLYPDPRLRAIGGTARRRWQAQVERKPPHQAQGEGRDPPGTGQACRQDGRRFRCCERFVRESDGRGDDLGVRRWATPEHFRFLPGRRELPDRKPVRRHLQNPRPSARSARRVDRKRETRQGVHFNHDGIGRRQGPGGAAPRQQCLRPIEVREPARPAELQNELRLLPPDWHAWLSHPGEAGRLGDDDQANGWVWWSLPSYQEHDRPAHHRHLQGRCRRQLAQVCPAAAADRNGDESEDHRLGNGGALRGLISRSRSGG